MRDGSRTTALKAREERRRVMLPARMRSASGWSDACILNVSKSGLLVYSPGAAEPGSFVEIRRGGQLVVARVVWRKNQRIGLHSPDPVRVEDIISTEAAATAVQSAKAQFAVERRRIPRNPDRSRQQARAMEFAAMVLGGLAFAGAAVATVEEALATPLAAVRVALGPG
jgi:hypothetical protein